MVHESCKDGLGQSMATDALWIWRFRQCRKRRLIWQAPTEKDNRTWADDESLQRFGDSLIAVADVGNRRWMIVERDWHGWPDPPEWAFFAIENNNAVWAAADFDIWPDAWTRPNDVTETKNNA